jgi:hypothetical protein
MGFIQPEEKIMMVGDGMPDLRVYKEKLADYFLDFAINKNRKLKKHRIADDSKFIICRRHEDMDAFLQTVV